MDELEAMSRLGLEELKPAAVLVPLIVDNNGHEPPGHQETSPFFLKTKSRLLQIPSRTDVLLTVRSSTVEHHKSQISFPGGVREPGDASLLETALRETMEEIGLERRGIEVVGELPEVPTFVTQYRVRPFIGVVRGRPVLRPNPSEIEEIIFVPLRHLMDPAHLTMETYERSGVNIQTPAYHFHTHRIWGATARMLQSLLENLVTTA
jgi:8-oxo-dGTP pyrophosphatase MutT (NUDIX family)